MAGSWPILTSGGGMLGHIFLFVYILAVGMAFAAVAMSLLYWLQKRNSGRLNMFLFISYLTLVLLIAGLRFYWADLLGGSRTVSVGTGLAEFAGYALLLYYLPATVNHIVYRKWTPLRLASAVTAAAVYFALGAVYLFTGFHESLFTSAGFLYLLSLAIILADILRSLSLIRRAATRLTVLGVTILTAVFLPLVFLVRLLADLDAQWDVDPSLRILFLSLYYFWLSLAGLVFYIREMSVPVGGPGAGGGAAGAVSAGAGDEHGAVFGGDSVGAGKIPRGGRATRSGTVLGLTDREKSIAEFLVQGLTYGEIAAELDISLNTVRAHVSNLYKKLSVRSKVELVGVLHDREDES